MASALNSVNLTNLGNILYLSNNITTLSSNLTIGTSPVANEQFYLKGNANITGNLIAFSNLLIPNGNLGINTANPRYALDVAGAANISGNLNFSGNLLQNGSPYIGSQWVTSGPNIYYNVAGGNVGIATSTPKFELDVGGNINLTGNLYQNGLPYASSQWITGNGSGNIYYIGNVGINKSTPIYALDVAGDSNIGGNVYGDNFYIRNDCILQNGNFSILNGNLTVYEQFNALGESYLNGNLTVYNSDIYNYGNIYTYNGLYMNKNGALYNQNETVGQHAFYAYDTVNFMTTLFGGADDTNKVGYIGVGGYGTSLPLILNPLGGNVGINNGNPRQRLDVAGSANISGNMTINANANVIGNLGINGNLFASSNLLILNGNIGIGTDQINSNLTVFGTANIGNVDFQLSVSKVHTVGGKGCIIRAYDTTGNTIIQADERGVAFRNLLLNPGNPNIVNASNVGIGTFNPQHKLDVNGGANIALNMIMNSNANVFGNLGISGNIIGASNIILLNGRLGVGMTNPAYTLDVAGDANISSSIFASNQTVNITSSTVTIKSVSGSGSVQQLLNFDTHGAGRGGGILFTQPDANVRQFLGRGYIGNATITSISYNTTTTGESVYHSGTASSGNVTKMSLTDTGNMALAGTLLIGANANVIGNLGITGNIIGTSNLILLNGRMGLGITNPAYTIDVAGSANISSNTIMNANANVLGNLGVTGNIIGSSNIVLPSGRVVVGSSNPTSTLLVTGNARVTANLYVGPDLPLNLQTGTPFFSRNTSTIDSNISGSLSGNVYHQLAFGSRNWAFAQDISSDLTLLFGCQGGGDPDPDFEYFFKKNTGLQIQPNPSVITTDFTEALKVLGTANITGNVTNFANLIIPNGNLGIGTSNPAFRFHSFGNANIAGNLFVTDNVKINGNLQVGTSSIYLLGDQNRLGVGKIPTYDLDVVGNINITGSFYQDGNAITMGSQWTTSGSNIYYNVSNGNVGIGTATPLALLDINGNARITGNLNVDNGTFWVDATNNRVGINTTIPLQALDVKGSANVSVNTFIRNNLAVGATTAGANLDVVGNARISGNLNVDNGLLWTNPVNNRVGILNTNPQYALDVNGNANITGNVIINNTALFNSLQFLSGSNMSTPFKMVYGNVFSGSVGATNSFSNVVTFPNSFSAVPWIILVTTSTAALPAGATDYSTTGCTIIGRNMSGSSSFSTTATYLAIGPA